MILAQLSVYPIGESTSLSRFVRSTAVEVPDLDSLFLLVKKVHQAHLEEGAKRIAIDLKVDDRRDKDATLESKRNSVK